MRKFRYLILTDNPDLLDELNAHLGGFDHLVFRGAAIDLPSAVDLVIEELPDLVFLAVSDDHKRTSLSLALIPELERYLRLIPKVVLLSNDPHMAVEGLRYEVFDFVLTPVRKIDLVKSILKFDRTLDQPGVNGFSTASYDYSAPAVSVEPELESDTSDLIGGEESLGSVDINRTSEPLQEISEKVAQIPVKDPIAADKEKPLVICVKSYGDYRFINADEICYLKADNNSTDIHLSNGEMITAFKTLKHFENVLESPFVRIHNSYIVNIDYVSRIHTGNSVCYLKHNGAKLPFSKSYKENVDAILHNITKGNYLEI